ncbi:hypothetical protein BDW59DRAFT_157726 [Aspergillus cavernicola]|uniref:Uncharacterized protein n=1 Tax=Aspergillus cavernicola TaxID=176166 RepID=A0ABR4IW02_9EURO
MDRLEQRLMFASMWAFEIIGVQELEDELHQALPQLNCHCEYSNAEEVLVIKGKLEGFTAPVTAMISSFIEKQKNKDLLDTPRLRLLNLPVVIPDNISPMEASDATENGGLLALDDDAEVVPHPMMQVTKFWLSSDGGVGCFGSSKYQEMLSEISKGTGTNIAVIDDLKGLQVSGRCETDVDDALTKLTRIEKPLSYLHHPLINNLMVSAVTENSQYRVQPYASLYPVALRRILADVALDGAAGLGQMFVTASYAFDEELQKYTPLKNLLQPPRHGHDEKSRLWNDFTFRKIGNEDNYRAMESVTENNHTKAQLFFSGMAASHPYLSPEKAKQVNEWVVDGASIGTTSTDQGIKVENISTPSSQPGSSAMIAITTGPELKKPPGIKVRRPVQPAQGVQNTKQPATELKPSEPLMESDVTTTPRKRWKLNYELSLGHAREDPAPSAENKIDFGNPLGPAFDASRYGLKNISPQPRKRAEKASRNIPPIRGRQPRKQNKLIDLQSPVNTTNITSHPPLQFDAPALVPEPAASSGRTPSASSSSAKERSMLLVDSHLSDLAGLNFLETTDHVGSATSDSLKDASSTDQERRLRVLNSVYQTNLALTVSVLAKPPHTCTGDFARFLGKQYIEDYERALRPEAEQTVNETESRKYYRTMSQKTASPCQKAKRAALLAKKQAATEYASGTPKPKKPSEEDLQDQKVSSRHCSNMSPISENAQGRTPLQATITEDLRRFFMALKSMLVAAEVFPGILTFEVQFGLIFFPLVPKTCSDGLMSASEWAQIFQPQTGITAPTTKFINSVTVCSSDVDHIIDLNTSKAEGKSRMFEQDYSEYNINYEFHCRTKADEFLIIAIDEQGGYSIQHASSMLGAVNLHFPGQIWDARAVAGSAAEYRPGSNPEFEETARYLVDSVYIPAGKQIRILTHLPKGNKLAIEKVFLKRWTRHRYLRPNEAMGPDAQAGERQPSGGQDIFLQVKEIQDLLIGTQESATDRKVRARFTTTNDMRQRGKSWYEVSLVSPSIETMLKANSSLEIGERTDDWRAADLFGNDAAFLMEQGSDSPTSPVAAAIGAGGIADLFRLTKTVVEKLDSIGSHNSGPMADTPRLFGAGSQANNGLDFDELESVKEVESVTAGVRHAPALNAQAVKREQYERDYW